MSAGLWIVAVLAVWGLVVVPVAAVGFFFFARWNSKAYPVARRRP
jgi:hypothetical protein